MTIEIEYVDLVFGEKPYRIPAAGLRRSEQWRGRLQMEINSLLAALKEQGGFFETVDFGNLQALAGLSLVELLPVLGTLFARLNLSMSGLVELITAYHPDLEKDQDYIQERATMKQAVAAVMEMVKLEYPFGLLRTRPKSPLNGPETATTSRSWPSALGELAQPN